MFLSIFMFLIFRFGSASRMLHAIWNIFYLSKVLSTHISRIICIIGGLDSSLAQLRKENTALLKIWCEVPYRQIEHEESVGWIKKSYKTAKIRRTRTERIEPPTEAERQNKAKAGEGQSKKQMPYTNKPWKKSTTAKSHKSSQNLQGQQTTKA